MDPYGAENITTALALAITIWMIAVRIRSRSESNLPLFYYLGVVVFSYLFPGVLEPRWIYAGVVTALFLRFEFMGGWFLKIVRGFEFIVLAYILIRFGTHVVMF